MKSNRLGLVEIAEDFLFVQKTMREIFASFRQGTARFDQVQRLVGASEGCALFRLKENCHARFRQSGPRASLGVRREALFDLAVGSLFHEAMKLRENLYQLEIYTPRVRQLRQTADEDAGEIFDEFEKILRAAKVRLQEALQETEVLVDQTCRQFRVLLADQKSDGLLMRYLIQHRELVEEVFDQELELLLTELHGGAAGAFEVAAHSYLESAFFADARDAIGQSIKHSASSGRLEWLSLYADGMQAFCDGQYGRSLDLLSRWVSSGPPESEKGYAHLAYSALSRVDQLVEAPEDNAVRELAASLVLQLEPFAEASGAPPNPDAGLQDSAFASDRRK